MSVFIKKETIQRLLKDVKEIIRNPLTDQGIYYTHDDTDILKGYAMIVGPSDTPYFGGYYFFEFVFPVDYPHSPPKVKYCTNGNNIRFNPNLYACGKVCVSLLNTWRGDQWTSCQSISTILLTLCTLLCKNPLLNEPGVNKFHIDMDDYNQIIEFANLNIAVCDILSKKEGVYLPFFGNFYPFMKELFLKNYEKLLEFASKKNNELKNTEVNFKTTFYSMNINVDYNVVINRLKSTFEKVEPNSTTHPPLEKVEPNSTTH
jgi:ubiquitin-conjugating enzyme E2 Z